jgi:sugar lactone lactonase YvrE
VRWRTVAGDGRLPHPWVQALLVVDDGLYVGTYGGGLVRRKASVDGGRYDVFAETEGLKISAGGLLEAGGRVFAGTEGNGLLRLDPERKRFEPLALPLPSPTVTALAARDGSLWVGTDEGLARLSLAAIGGAP